MSLTPTRNVVVRAKVQGRHERVEYLYLQSNEGHGYVRRTVHRGYLGRASLAAHACRDWLRGRDTKEARAQVRQWFKQNGVPASRDYLQAFRRFFEKNHPEVLRGKPYAQRQLRPKPQRTSAPPLSPADASRERARDQRFAQIEAVLDAIERANKHGPIVTTGDVAREYEHVTIRQPARRLSTTRGLGFVLDDMEDGGIIRRRVTSHGRYGRTSIIELAQPAIVPAPQPSPPRPKTTPTPKKPVLRSTKCVDKCGRKRLTDRPRCRECHNAARRRRYATDSTFREQERARARVKKRIYFAKNRELVLGTQRARYHQDAEFRRRALAARRKWYDKAMRDSETRARLAQSRAAYLRRAQARKEARTA